MTKQQRKEGSLKSKIAFFVAIFLFVLMTYTTKYSPFQIAPSLVLICGIYLGRYPKEFQKS